VLSAHGCISGLAAGKAVRSISPGLLLRTPGFEDNRAITAGFAGVNELERLCRQLTRKMEPQNTQNTQMDTSEDRANLLSKRIIGSALTVLHALGAGFLEKVYEDALVHELRKSGLAVSQQHPMVVRYDGIVVGEYAVDLLVEHIVLVELKVAKAIDEIHLAQCLNYLKATGLHLCLLLNFGKPRLEIKRIVLAL
jgi:GxxExxY protein